MPSWLEQPSSLNWANKQKLRDQILLFQKNISETKSNLTYLSSLVGNWENLSKELLILSEKQQLTAKMVLQLRPFLDQSELFREALKNFCSEKLTFLPKDNNDQFGL